jgi:hypothetical protein
MENSLQGTKYESLINNWLAVSKMETGGWKSGLYLNYNNPWGMRPSKVREHTQSGVVVTENNGEFATYDSLSDAAKDIFLYSQARRFPIDTTLWEHIAYMFSKGYSTSETAMEYYKRVKAWLER